MGDGASGEVAGDGGLAGVGPLDELFEGTSDFLLAEGAVAVAMDVLLDEILRGSGQGDLLGVEGEGPAGDAGVVGGVEGEHGAAETAGRGVVVEQVIAGAGVGGVPFDAVVEEVIEGGGGGVGAGVEEVAVVKGIAAGAALKVADDVGEVDDGGGDLAIGVEAHEVSQGGGVRGGWP